MADPVSLTIAIASTALQAGSSLMEGNAAYSQNMADAATATENARIARQNARDLRTAGNAAMEAKARQVRKDLGRTAAAASQSGTGGPGYGSNLAVLKQASTEGKFDVLNTGYQYETQAYGSDVEALGLDQQAKAARRAARGARTAGFIGAASAVLNGFSNYSGMKAQRASYSARSPYTVSAGGSARIAPRPTYGRVSLTPP